MSTWRYNPARQRNELFDAGPQGDIIHAVVITPGADVSDVPDAQVIPAGPETQAAFKSGDPAAINKVLTDLHADTKAANTSETPPAGQQGASGETRAVNWDPADVAALQRNISAGLDLRTAVNQSNQADYTLRQQMLAAGQDPSYWFNQGQPQGGTSGTPSAGDNPYSTGILPSPDEMDNWTEEQRIAGKAALLGRAERMQQVGNAFTAHQAGAQRLGDYQSTAQQIADLKDQIAHEETRAGANPRGDSFDQWTNPDGTQNGGHASTAGARRQLAALERQRGSQEQQIDPRGYATNQRAATALTDWQNTPQGVREAQYGTAGLLPSPPSDVDSERLHRTRTTMAAGLPAPPPVPMPYARGGVRRYAEGGDGADGSGGSGSGGGGALTVSGKTGTATQTAYGNPAAVQDQQRRAAAISALQAKEAAAQTAYQQELMEIGQYRAQTEQMITEQKLRHVLTATPGSMVPVGPPTAPSYNVPSTQPR